MRQRRKRRKKTSVPSVSSCSSPCRCRHGFPNSPSCESSTQLQESLGHLWPFPFLLVLEKDERIPPVLLTHPLPPRLQLRIAIIGTPQTQIAPIRRCYERNRKIIFRFGDAQHRMKFAKQTENLVVKPR